MRRAIAALTKNWLTILLAAFAVAAVLTATLASNLVPRIGVTKDLRPIAYDLSIGYLLSYLFFILVVVIPQRISRRRTTKLLAQHYRAFKLSCIEIYLSAIGNSWDSDLPEKLLDPSTFSEYFSERHAPSQNRWHAVHNGLYDYGIPQLVVECELFAREIEYTLIKLDLEDEDVALFLKRLGRSLLRLRNSKPDYDDVKGLLFFLYPIHSHWSLLDGVEGRDPIGEMIARM